MNDVMEIIRVFAVALLIALTVVGVPYLAFVLATAPIRRQSAIQLVVAQLSATVRQHISLSTGLAIAALSEPPRPRRRLVGMSKLIAAGRKLSDAMRSAFPECPGLLISLVDAGERSGQLPAAVQQAERLVHDQARLRQMRMGSPLPYALGVIAFATSIMFMVSVIIVPKFEEIFRDFQVEFSAWSFQNLRFLHMLLVALLVALLIFIPVSFLLRIIPRSTPVPNFISRKIDWMRWHTPGLSTMEHAQGMSAAFGAMKFCVDSGMNLHETVAIAADLDINWQLRQKLRRLSIELSNGVDVRKATKASGIGGIAAIVLSTGTRRRDFSSALAFASDYYGSIISRWWLLISNLTWPISTLLLATLIGMLVFSMFQPLLLLIDATMNSTGF